jgi:methanogenic corrinoid protein MtbC1
MSDEHSLITALEKAIESGDEVAAPAAAQQLLAQGGAPREITAALSRAMHRLGEQFHRLEIYVPDLLVAADAFEAVMEFTKPALEAERKEIKSKGTVVIGTVAGDVHTLGKDLVRALLAADGFEVIDLGRDVPAQVFIATAQQAKAQIIALSALMSTTMPEMKKVVDELRARGLGDHKVMIGGAPVTQHYANEIGADGYAEDASTAVALANQLIASNAAKEDDVDRA